MFAALLAGTALGFGARSAAAAQPISYIYWDENERELFYNNPSTTPIPSQTYCNPVPGDPTCMVQNWDSNGQMCIFPDTTGRFTTGQNPTNADQLPNPGANLPKKSPPVGEAVWDIHGNYTGRTLYVPGPYKGPWETASDPGGDIPPDVAASGNFNNNGTMTGCVFDSMGNLFAVDLGSSQGTFPPNDTGRLIEWYAGDNYTDPCVIYGPNAGGDVPAGTKGLHHVDGTGGLFQPGTLARDSSDNIYVPSDTFSSTTGGIVPTGEVLKFNHASFPANAAACHNTINQSATMNNVNANPDEFHQATFSIFIQGSGAFLPLPAGIARDPVCKCWAVSDVIGSPAIGYFDDTGAPLPRAVATGSGPPGNPNFNPYGIAVDPMGNLFAVDIHLTQGCNTDVPGSCVGLNIGPQNNAGQLLEWMFPSSTAGPSGPATKIGGATPASPNCLPNNANYPCGYNFPVSVTSCNPQIQTCPTPAPAVVFPETPWMPALLLAGAGLVVIGVRRKQLRLA